MKINNLEDAKELLRIALFHQRKLLFMEELSSETQLVFLYEDVQYVLYLETCTVEELVDLVGYTSTDRSKELTKLVRDANEFCYPKERADLYKEPSPLGLVPREMWQELRKADIIAAMKRFREVNKEIPLEWIDELLDYEK